MNEENSFKKEYRKIISKNAVENVKFSLAFLQLIRGVNPDLADKVGWCGRFWKKFECVKARLDNSHYPIVAKPCLCKDKHGCPRCGRIIRYELGDRVTDLCRHANRGKVGKLCVFGIRFTVPPKLWSKIDETTMVIFRRLAIETVKEFFGKDIEIGGVAADHYWHSRDPFLGFFPHIHIRISDICLMKKDGSLHRLRGFLTKERLAELNESWRLNVEKAFNTPIVKVVVNHNFAEGHHKVRKQLAYDFREPIEDVYKFLQAGGNYDKRGLEFFRRLIVDRKKNARHIVYFGWMNEKRVAGFMKQIDVQYETLKEWRRKRRALSEVCPVHPDEKLVELGGRYLFSELEEECMFVGYSSDMPEMLSVDVSG